MIGLSVTAAAEMNVVPFCYNLNENWDFESAVGTNKIDCVGVKRHLDELYDV